MSKDPLETAIELIKSGKQADALPILTMLIRSDPHDEKAWVWLIQAVPADQRRQAAQMFFKDNPDSDLAKKALRAAGREASNSSAAVPVISPAMDNAQNDVAPSVRDSPKSNDNQLSEMIRKEGNTLPETAADRAAPSFPLPVMSEKKGKPLSLLILGLAALIIVVISVFLFQKGIFANLLGLKPTQIPNVETQFAEVKKQTPAKTTTPISIVSPTIDVNDTPTIAPTLLSTPLAFPSGAPLIGPENAQSLRFVSEAQISQQSVLISPSYKYILPMGGSSEIRLLDFNTNEPLFHAYLPSDSLALAAFSPDEAFLAAAVNHGDIIIFDIQAGKSIRTIRTGSLVVENTGSMAYSGDGHTLAVISAGQYGIWNAGTGEILGTGSSLNVTMAVSGKMLFLSCASYVCAEDIATGKQVRHFEANGVPPIFALSTDGERIAVNLLTQESTNEVVIYNAADGTQRAVVDTPFATVWGLVYAPDGRTIAAWGINHDKSAYSLVIIDTEEAKILNTLDIGPYQANIDWLPQKISFTPDGTGIAVLTSNKVVIFAAQ